MDLKQIDNLKITKATESDFSAIQEIYSYYVKNTVISFEESEPDIEELIKRWRILTSESLPYIVAKINNKIVGYAYASKYHPRSAYRFTIEESVYLAQDYQGYGIGKKLLSELIKLCQQQGYKQMIAIIAGPENSPSVKFHKKMNFKISGTLEKVGFKFDKQVDTVLMQREL